MTIEQGMAAYEEGNLAQAERLFREALATPLAEEDAGCAEVYLGAILGQQAQRDLAMNYFAHALERKLSVPLMVSARYHAGLVSCELQRFAEAVDHLTAALRLAQAEPGAGSPEQIRHGSFLLGWAHHELGQYERALESLERAGDRVTPCTEDSPNLDGQIALWKGSATFHLRRYEEALHWLEDALRPGLLVDPESRAVGRYYSAKCLCARGRTQEAIAMLCQILSSGEGRSELPERYMGDACYTFGKAYYDQGGYADAIPWLETAVGRSDANSLREGYVECVLAVCLVEVQRASEALRYAKHAYEANPGDPFRAICFARALAAVGEYAQAIGLVEEVHPERGTIDLQEDLLVQRCWLFATTGDRPRYEASYEELRARFSKSRALSDPTATRWLPPPDAIPWSSRDKFVG